MACNNSSTNCAPCQDCPPSPAPVLPRCQDVILADGAYPNATVVVQQGCITHIEAGEELAYQPVNCCGSAGGGSSDSGGLIGPKGDDGISATITVGSVTTGAYGEPPQVTNSGTPTAAILDFVIPEGERGEDGGSNIAGVTATVGAWEFETGLVKELPPDFPPICTLLAGTTNVVGLTLTITKNNSSGVTTIDVEGSAFLSSLNNTISGLTSSVSALQSTVNNLQGVVNTQQATITGLNNALSSLDARVTALENP